MESTTQNCILCGQAVNEGDTPCPESGCRFTLDGRGKVTLSRSFTISFELKIHKRAFLDTPPHITFPRVGLETNRFTFSLTKNVLLPNRLWLP